MKKINVILLLAHSLIITQLCYGGNNDNPHNISSDDWGTNGEACKICHPLQNNLTEIKYQPLWNNKSSTKNYTLYTSPTLDAVINQPDGSSKLCLSCHDGTIASNDIGIDLSNDHPVSFVYNSGLAIRDGKLNDPSVTDSGLGGTVEKDLLSFGKMQCTSCHNPHHSAYPKNLIMSNEQSELCLKCHNK